MKIPDSKEVAIETANQFNNWIVSNGKTELYPEVLEHDSLKPNLTRILFGSLFHGLLYLIRAIAKKLNIWSLVAFCALIRIKSDGWSSEPRQCGYNESFTLIGLYRLRNMNIIGAINALEKSWHVWPCPHNTSFGLKQSLAKELKKYPEAKDAVDTYLEVANAFNAYKFV